LKRRKIIGQNIYRLRMKAEMTQTQLADFAQLSKRYIQKIEYGEANITIDVVEKLAGIFKCGWKEIVGEIGVPDSVAQGTERK
jgi:transcriptional regulator with XRE-family HTH domain